MALVRSGAAGLRQWRGFAAGLQRAPRSRPPAARRRGVCVDAGVALRPVPGLTTLPWNATPEEEQVSGPLRASRERCRCVGPPGYAGARRPAASGRAWPHCDRRAPPPPPRQCPGRRRAAARAAGAGGGGPADGGLPARRAGRGHAAVVFARPAPGGGRGGGEADGVHEVARRLPAARRADEADSGKACLHAHPDVNGRPVIIVRVSQHVTGAAPGGPGQAPLQGGAARGRGARGRGARAERGARRAGEFPLDSSKRYCAYLLEQAIAQLPPDGETILGIFDLRGFKTRNADFGFVRFLVRGLAPGAWCLGSGVLPSSVPFLLRATALQRCAARSVVINIWCPHMKRNLPSI